MCNHGYHSPIIRFLKRVYTNQIFQNQIQANNLCPQHTIACVTTAIIRRYSYSLKKCIQTKFFKKKAAVNRIQANNLIPQHTTVCVTTAIIRR